MSSLNASFIGYTVGLFCHSIKHNRKPALVAVEIHRLQDSRFKLQAVSARNLAPFRGDYVIIAEDEYENAPRNPYDDCEFAVWALRKCGWNAG